MFLFGKGIARRLRRSDSTLDVMRVGRCGTGLGVPYRLSALLGVEVSSEFREVMLTCQRGRRSDLSSLVVASSSSMCSAAVFVCQVGAGCCAEVGQESTPYFVAI